ncbi:MAG TPA: VOC family protein [Vicinamibacterales bacterium]|nr:VOC family protein [Vicinamibacterales bacterium]
MPLTPGSFCWFELGTTDADGAKAFYGPLFGWSPVDIPMGHDAGAYTIFKLDGGDTGAAYPLTKEQRSMGVPPNWLAYVAVTNVEEMVKRARTLGATILQDALEVPGQGRLAVLQDPTGAVLALWQASGHTGVGVSDVPGTACWVELSSPDQEQAAQFYAQLFGWGIDTGKSTNPDASGDYLHIQHDGKFVGGIVPASARDANTPPHWLIYFKVADCAAATTQALGLGAQAYVQNMSIGKDGVISVLADPQGAVFALHQAN